MIICLFRGCPVYTQPSFARVHSLLSLSKQGQDNHALSDMTHDAVAMHRLRLLRMQNLVEFVITPLLRHLFISIYNSFTSHMHNYIPEIHVHIQLLSGVSSFHVVCTGLLPDMQSVYVVSLL